MPVDITIDITGSEGAAFNGPIDAKRLQKTQRVEPFGKAEIAQLRLFSDWQLKFRVTYNIVNVQEDKAAAIALPPTKGSPRRRGEDKKKIADQLEESGRFDNLTASIIQSKQSFKTFDYNVASIHQIQDMMVTNKQDSFTDIEFPPTDMAIHDPNEKFPFKSEIYWKRAKDFLSDENGKPPKAILSLIVSFIFLSTIQMSSLIFDAYL